MRRELSPDPGWVRELTGASASRAERAIDEARSDGRLFGALAREHRREGRVDYGEIVAPLELHAIARILRPRHVVEVGVSSGVSSAYLLRALDANGKGTLHSVDRPSKPARSRGTKPPRSSWSLPDGRSTGWAVPDRLRPRWDLRIGDKAVVLPLLAAELPEVGLLVYDVPHWDRDALREFRGIGVRIPSGGVAVSDHGTPGERCDALAAWAREEGEATVGRRDSGLFAFAKG